MKALFAKWLIVTIAALRGYNEGQTKVLLAQSALETGNWTSKHWYSDKNLFGMSQMRNEARRRRLVGVRLGPDGLYRAQFRHLAASVQDRLDWDQQMGVDKANYLQSMSSKYHPSPDYAAAVGGRISDDINRTYWIALMATPVTILIVWKIVQELGA